MHISILGIFLEFFNFLNFHIFFNSRINPYFLDISYSFCSKRGLIVIADVATCTCGATR